MSRTLNTATSRFHRRILTEHSVVDKRASADEATAYVVDKRASADEATAYVVDK